MIEHPFTTLYVLDFHRVRCQIGKKSPIAISVFSKKQKYIFRCVTVDKIQIKTFSYCLELFRLVSFVSSMEAGGEETGSDRFPRSCEVDRHASLRPTNDSLTGVHNLWLCVLHCMTWGQRSLLLLLLHFLNFFQPAVCVLRIQIRSLPWMFSGLWKKKLKSIPDYTAERENNWARYTQ